MSLTEKQTQKIEALHRFQRKNPQFWRECLKERNKIYDSDGALTRWLDKYKGMSIFEFFKALRP